MVKIRNKKTKGRFALVGAIATSIDFSLLFGLSIAGMPSVAANFFSTTGAFCFSFFANRHYAFKATDGHIGKQIVLYIVITLFGIWVLQPPVIYFGEHFLKDHFHGLSWWIILALSKLLATGVTLIWNYFTYSRIVFKDSTADNHPEGE